MAEEWYYTSGGARLGPVELAQLQRLIAAGSVLSDDLVWHDAMADWVPASQVQVLFAQSEAVQPVHAAKSAEIPIAALAEPAASVLAYSTGAPNRPTESGPTIYAGFFLRFLAYVVDGIILLIITVPVALGFMFVIGVLNGLSGNEILHALSAVNANPLAGLVLRMLIGGVGWLYFAYQESSPAQATLGKRFLGMVVTDTQGNRISLLRASGRHFGKLVSGFTFAIGYIMAGFTARKQALHDMMAGCLVVLKPN